jgi:hypothetical protein
MNVEIEAEAALLPEKEYIKGIFFAVHVMRMSQEFIRGYGKWYEYSDKR